MTERPNPYHNTPSHMPLAYPHPSPSPTPVHPFTYPHQCARTFVPHAQISAPTPMHKISAHVPPASLGSPCTRTRALPLPRRAYPPPTPTSPRAHASYPPDLYAACQDCRRARRQVGRAMRGEGCAQGVGAAHCSGQRY